MPEHVVRQGECLSSIAAAYGLRWKTIYHHERNAAFRRKRPDPNVILPGDRLFVPEPSRKSQGAATERRHRFRWKVSGALLRVVVADAAGEPHANCAYRLSVGRNRHGGRTTGEGLIEARVPPSERTGTLELWLGGEEGEGASGPPDVLWSLELGELDPVEEWSGIQARLANLGYYDGRVGSPNEATRIALEDFQNEEGLPVSGEPEAPTRERLVERHGS